MIRYIFRGGINRAIRFVMGGAFVALSVVAAAFILHRPEPPIVYHGGDAVIQKRIHAGSSFTVLRNFTVREKGGVVTRRMVKGDCKVGCSVIDLPTGVLFWEPGNYSTLREIKTPPEAAPGKWRLEFAVVFENYVGMNFTFPLPMLEIEVVPNGEPL